MRGKFRWKTILLLTLIGAGASGGWFFLHRYQVRRLNGSFLEQAVRAEDMGQAQRANRFLRQYLLINRDDVDTRARFGLSLENLATTPKAFNDALGVYEQVLAQDPDRHDIRKRAAKLALRLGKVDAALGHLEHLKKAGHDDAGIRFLAGECYALRKDFKEALGELDVAIKKDPTLIDAYLRKTLIQDRMLKEPGEAIKTLERMVSANPESSRAYLVRAVFRQEGAKPNLPAAEEDLVVARRLAPDDPEVLLVSGTQRLAEAATAADGDQARYRHQARAFLEHAAKRAPGNARVYSQLATVELRAGKPAEAIAHLRAGQKKVNGPGRLEILRELAELLVGQREFTAAAEVVDQLRKLGYPRGRLDLMRAKLAMGQGRWNDAANLLEEARGLLPVDALNLVLTADLLLGRCFEQMGDLDRQLAAYRHAAKLAPLDPAPRLGLTLALHRLGRLDDAIEECERMMGMERPAAYGWTMLARLLILKNLQHDERARQWEPVEKVLNVAAKTGLKSAEVDILRADVVYLATGDAKAARAILETARPAHAKDVGLWIALAELAGREGKTDEALRILRDAQKVAGDGADLRLAHLRFTPVKQEDARAYLQRLATDLDRFDVAARGRLLGGLADAFARAGELKQAEALLIRLVALEPNALQARLQLFDLYLRTGNRAGMETTVAGIRRIEGDQRPLGHYGAAQVLIWRAQQGEKDLTADARAHLLAASAKRPGWSRIPLALAAIAELEHDTEATVKYYRDAVNLGNRQPAVVRALVELLLKRREYAEADTLIRKLAERDAISNDLQRLAAELSIYNGNPERAMGLARSAVRTDSRDFRDHLWYGQVLWSLGKRDEAEAAFRKSVEYAKGSSEPYVLLVELYARSEEPTKARAVMAQLRKQSTAADLPLVLARCHQVLGDTTVAETLYQEALAAAPTDLAVLKDTAEFFQKTGQPQKAEPLLRRLLAPTAKSAPALAAWARRNLALALGLTGGPKEQKDEAMALVELNLTAQADSVDDQLVKSLLLAGKPGRRGEAIALMEKVFKIRPATPSQEFALASLYQAEGNWPKARTQMLHLVSVTSKAKDDPQYLAAFVENLLKRGELGEAKIWLDQLHDAHPHTFATMALRARYAAAKGNGEATLEIVQHYLAAQQSMPAEPTTRLSMAANLLEGLAVRHGDLREKLLPAAETMLRSYVQKSDQPASRLALADFFGRHGRLAEALDVCEAALAQVAPHQVASIAVAAVARNTATAEQMQRVERWLRTAQQKDPKMPGLNTLEAILRERQGRFAEAESLYRGVLAQEPSNVVVGNNLAVLLGFGAKKVEALRLIESAIDTAGPVGELLDSRAAILLAAGRHADAEKDLAEALREAKTAGRLFHLAQARLATGRAANALEAFAEARRLGIQIASVHPLERPAYDALVKMDAQQKKPR